MTTLTFKEENIKTLQSLDNNKTHGLREISVRMIKICDTALVKSLSFPKIAQNLAYFQKYQKINTCPLHKKNEK